MKSNKAPIFILISIIVATGAILALGNPHSTSWPLKCLFYHLTGFKCPLCGMQRAVHELLHGNIKEAWTLNPGFFLLSPYLCLLLLGQISPTLMNNNSIIRFCYRNNVIFTILALTIVWGIVRNVI